ncbi:MAG: hypothetical protein JWN00_2894 [Actinomycetia bacterium]|nr:hypothetical protein [Actinomycetes bacterium]
MTPSEPVRIAMITLPGTEYAVAQARGYARDIFGPHHPALADMQICISEGFTNGIRHTLSGLGGKITVTFSTVPGEVVSARTALVRSGEQAVARGRRGGTFDPLGQLCGV